MPDSTSSARPLFIPVVLGTARKGRMSEHGAQVVLAQLQKQAGVETELIDIRTLPMPVDDAGEAIKNPEFSAKMTRADALAIVSPEYNHGYSGLLKHVLDSCLKEYIHKAVGIVGVSAGPFGGTRGIQDLLPVMRELGLVNIFWDVNFSNSYALFDDEGKLLDEKYIPRIDKFLAELIWMAKTLRYGREHIALSEANPEVPTMAREAVICPICGIEMNHHADKLVYAEGWQNSAHGGGVEEFHSCPNCGRTESRTAE